MRILNRAHVPWFAFVCLATLAAIVLYAANFHPEALPGIRLPSYLIQTPSDHHSIGGTPLGLIFGAVSFGIFIFAALLSLRKKIPLWRIGTVQRWLRAHIWLTFLTVPLILLHSGFRLGGPMTTLLMILYALVMISGVYGLILQHQMPALMKERLPAETVFEQIPHIRGQLVTAATKMRDSFKPAPPVKTDTGAPASSTAKAVTAETTPMASTAADLSTPTARAKTVVGSTITAGPVTEPPPESKETKAAVAAANAIAHPPKSPETIGSPTPEVATPTEARVTPPPPMKPGETIGTPTARVPEGAPIPAGTESAPVKLPADKTESATITASPTPIPQTAKPVVAAAAPVAPKPVVAAAAALDPDSEATLVEFLDRQVIPYLSAKRGDRYPLGKTRFSEDTFRFVRLRIAQVYRVRVDEIQAWCDERRMLDLQTRMHHWLHGWLFVHVPFSFLLLMLTAWHAFVTLFYY
jgi:hypothetical protein